MLTWEVDSSIDEEAAGKLIMTARKIWFEDETRKADLEIS